MTLFEVGSVEQTRHCLRLEMNSATSLSEESFCMSSGSW